SIHSGRSRTRLRIRSCQPLREAHKSMQASGAHLGSATDANGTVIGIVTLEDMLEELVAQIRADSRRVARSGPWPACGTARSAGRPADPGGGGARAAGPW